MPRTPITMLAGAIAIMTAFYAVPAFADPAFATRNVNVRSGPGLTYEAVDRLVSGEPVERGNCNSDGSWCYIRHEGTNGWVPAVLLENTPSGLDPQEPDTPPVAGMDNDYTARSVVNVRSGPGTNFATVDRLKAGEAVTRGQCTSDGGWCYVNHDGADGWVSASFLAPVNRPPPSNPPSGGGDTSTITRIASSPVNVRTGPSTDFKIVSRLTRGESVEVAQCTSDRSWCYVSHNGPDGWVAADYLRTPGSGNNGGYNGGGNGGNTGGNPNPPATATQNIGTAIASMPVRGAPTLFTSTVGQLSRGQKVPVDQCSDDGYWCHVADDSVNGWVPAAFLNITEVEVPMAQPSTKAMIAAQTQLHRMPGNQSQVVASLPVNARVDVQRCGPAGNWCQVTYGQQSGWVEAAMLKPVEAVPARPPAGQQPDNSVCITGFGGIQFCVTP